MVNIRQHLLLFLKGCVIGIANIIPGVSGGTIAVVLGVYEKIIDAISNFFTNKAKRLDYLIFLATIILGAIVIIFLSARLMKYLLENYGVYTNLAFVGLIAGSIPSIYQSHEDMKLSVPALLSFIAGVAIILIFEFGFPDVEKQEGHRVALTLTANSALMLWLSGFLGGGAMIVPGVSGSFVMLLMGQYYIVTSALAGFNLIILIIAGVGIVPGIIVFARLINYSLKHFPKETYYFILGLVLASLISIYPGLPDSVTGIAIAVLITAVFFSVSFIIGKQSTSQKS